MHAIKIHGALYHLITLFIIFNIIDIINGDFRFLICTFYTGDVIMLFKYKTLQNSLFYHFSVLFTIVLLSMAILLYVYFTKDLYKKASEQQLNSAPHFPIPLIMK